MRKSKVKRLPAPLREALESLWREGRYTLDELLNRLREMAPAVGARPEELPSRSGLHSYLQHFEKKLARYREAQQVAGMWVAKLGEDPQGDVGRLLAEMLKSIALQTMDAAGESGEPTGAQDLMLLSAALKNLAAAEKTWADRELRIRKELAAQVEQVIEQEKRPGGGLSEDAAARIRAALLGGEK